MSWYFWVAMKLEWYFWVAWTFLGLTPPPYAYVLSVPLGACVLLLSLLWQFFETVVSGTAIKGGPIAYYGRRRLMLHRDNLCCCCFLTAALEHHKSFFTLKKNETHSRSDWLFIYVSFLLLRAHWIILRLYQNVTILLLLLNCGNSTLSVAYLVHLRL